MAIALYLVLAVIPWQRAAQLEASGQPAQAATLLETSLKEYPQLFALYLRLGWLHFQAKDYPAAALRYKGALKLAPRNRDAHLGMGWTRYKQGQNKAAARHFQAALKMDPNNFSAQKGLALASPPIHLWAHVGLIKHNYGEHPDVSQGLGFGGGLFAQYQRWSGQFSYQSHQFEALADQIEGLEEDQESSQSQLFLSLDRRLGNWLLSLGYGQALDDLSSSDPKLGFLGVQEPYLGIQLIMAQARMLQRQANTLFLGRTFYFPSLLHLSLKPMLEVQSAEGESGFAVGLYTGILISRFSLGFGGWFGDLYHPIGGYPGSLYTLDGLFKRRLQADLGYSPRFLEGWSLSLFLEHAQVESDTGSPWSEETGVLWSGLKLGKRFKL